MFELQDIKPSTVCKRYIMFAWKVQYFACKRDKTLRAESALN